MANDPPSANEIPNIEGDRLNIVFLTVSYLLQGVVVSLSTLISHFLRNNHVSEQDRNTFSIIGYLYVFKILWAPFVDNVYSKKLGRRMTWLVLTQYLIGALLLLTSFHIDDWLGDEDGSRKANVSLLTIIFFLCTFLISVQDIALDGWTITIFQKRNIGYTALCQGIGFLLGSLITLEGFIYLSSKDFCNTFRVIPQDQGFTTLSEFIFFWGIVFVAITTVCLVFKKENSQEYRTYEPITNLKAMYALPYKILRIQPVQTVALFMFTSFICFGPIKAASRKLQEVGIPREMFVSLALPSIPFELILPLLLSRYLVGSRPMNAFFVFYLLRMMNFILYAEFIFMLSNAGSKMNDLSCLFLRFFYNFDISIGFLMGIALQAFCTRISDPRFGGLYMTLFVTASNVSFRWFSSLCQWLAVPITLQYCVYEEIKGNPVCFPLIIDGFFLEALICTLIGILWLIWGNIKMRQLQKLNSSSYTLPENHSSVDTYSRNMRLHPIISSSVSN